MSQHDLTIIVNTTILFTAITISLWIGLYALRRPRVAGTRPFSTFIFLEAAWMFGFLWEMYSPGLPAKIFWDNFQWVFTLFIPLAALAFAVEYSGIPQLRARWVWFALAAVPTLAVLLIFTNSWHGLAMQSAHLVEGEPFSEYVYGYGGLLLMIIAYDYLLLLAALAILIQVAFYRQAVYRAQTLTILAGLLIPIIGTLISLSGLRLWQFRDLSPITFTIANVVMSVGLFRYRIFNLLPLARGMVVESMEDGVIVLDAYERVVDVNQAAKTLLRRAHDNLMGLPAGDLLAGALDPADLNSAKPSIHKEVSLPGNSGSRTIDLRLTRLTNRAGSHAGYLILLRDISAHKQVENVRQSAFEEMERQVAERTAELSRTVGRLETEIRERRRVEEALRGQTHSLSAVSQLAISLAETSAEVDITGPVAENIREITGALGSVISIFDPQNAILSVKHIATSNWVFENLHRLVPDVFRLKMPVPPEILRQMTSCVVGRFTSLSDVTFDVIPEEHSRRLVNLLKIGEIISISLQVEGELYGSLVVFLPQGAPSPAVDMLEAYAHVVSVTLRRTRAEEALRASELRFRTLLENANDLITIVDSQGKQIFTYNVGRGNHLLGYTTEEMIKDGITGILHPDDVPKALEHLTRIKEQPGNHELFELRYRHKKGHWVTLETYARNLLHDPLIRGIVSTSRDVTERRQAEEEQRRLNRTLTMLSECNQALVRMNEEPMLLDAICHIIVELGGYRFVWFNYLKERPYPHMVPTAYYGAESDPFGARLEEELGQRNWMLELEEPPSPMELERRQMEAGLIELLYKGAPIVLNDVHEFEYPEHRDNGLRIGIASIVVLPLSYAGEVYGALHIHSSEPGAFDQKEVGLLTELAQDVSFGIHARRMRASRDRAEREARQASAELNQAYESTLEGWSRALELRERETAGHSQRVVELTLALAHQMGFTEEACTHIRRGALLHDIGKMGIPDSILLKPAKLTPEDWEIMRQHPVFARDLLSAIPYLEPALLIPYYHHERWDGSGYPQGLKGEEIPLPARIFAVIDVWDALSWDRPYRTAWSEAEVLQYLSDNAGILFDPRVVELFLKTVEDQRGR